MSVFICIRAFRDAFAALAAIFKNSEADLAWPERSKGKKVPAHSLPPLDHLDGSFGQGVEEGFAVALGEDAVVEDANEAFVAGGAD